MPAARAASKAAADAATKAAAKATADAAAKPRPMPPRRPPLTLPPKVRYRRCKGGFATTAANAAGEGRVEFFRQRHFRRCSQGCHVDGPPPPRPVTVAAVRQRPRQLQRRGRCSGFVGRRHRQCRRYRGASRRGGCRAGWSQNTPWLQNNGGPARPSTSHSRRNKKLQRPRPSRRPSQGREGRRRRRCGRAAAAANAELTRGLRAAADPGLHQARQGHRSSPDEAKEAANAAEDAARETTEAAGKAAQQRPRPRRRRSRRPPPHRSPLTRRRLPSRPPRLRDRPPSRRPRRCCKRR